MMKRLLLLALLLSALLPGVSWATGALIGSGVIAGAGVGGGTFTTGTYDTTGANFVVCGLVGTQANLPTVSDSNSNTWVTTLTRYSTTVPNSVKLFYVINPIVGAGQTFTATTAGAPTASMACLAFSGMDISAPIDVENGAASSGTTSLATGNVNCTTGDVAVTILGKFNGTLESIDNGFTKPLTNTTVGAQHYGMAMAYKIDPGSVNPTWSWTSSSSNAVAIACFKAAAAAGSSLGSSLGFLEVDE